MRYYCYNEWDPDSPRANGTDGYVETLSEEEIRQRYWPYWYGKMCEKFGQDHVNANLLATGPKEDPAVSRGLDFLLKTQQTDGDFPPQPIPGLFYRTTLIRYDHYKRAFPLKAFATFLQS